MLQTLVYDLRFALRSLRRAPGFVALVVLTLAAGIGLTTAIATVTDCVLLRPLGYRDADRIAALRTHTLDVNNTYNKVGGDDYNDLAGSVPGLEATAFYESGDAGVRLASGAVYEHVAAVSPRFMEIMGIEPLAGRLFRPDATEGTEALVSAAFARQHFGSVGAALGQTVGTDRMQRTVVGVTPDGFSFPENSGVWMETGPRPEIASRTAYNQRAIGKRREGVSLALLTEQLNTLSRHLQASVPEDRHKQLEAVSLQEQIVGRIRPTFHLLLGAVAVVLLIAGMNIAHLQIVRGAQRLRAVTIRTALGASRARMAAQALLESALLASAGTVAGVLLAEPALRWLLRLAPPEVPRLAEVHLSKEVFLFAFLVSLLLMSVAAVLPILHSWRVDPASALRNDNARGMENRSAGKLRRGLLVGEVALTLMLGVAAVPLMRQLLAESRTDLGFAADHLLTLDAHRTGVAAIADAPPDASEKAKSAVLAAEIAAARSSLTNLDTTLSTIGATPGVTAVGAIVGAPMGFDGSDVGYAIRGRQVFDPVVNQLPYADIRPVTPALFATMRMPVLRGRGFAAADRLFAPSVVMINAALARQQFPGQNPIGKQIMCGYDVDASWWTVVGVVGDIHADSPGSAPYPTLYVPVAQHPRSAGDLQIMVRTAAEPSAMADTLRRLLKARFPDLAIQTSTMTASIAEAQHMERFRAVLFGSFAGVSLLLAVVGMYGITAYSVAQRRFEFGLRLAVGATRTQLLVGVLRGALGTASIGTALGLLLATGFTRVLGSALGQLPASDPLAYLYASAAVLCLAGGAAWVPARRAAAAQPMQVLRYE